MPRPGPSLVFAIALALAGCVGAGGPEMSFRRVNFAAGAECSGGDCKSVIAAEGRVTRETPERFAEFVKAELAAAPMRNVVVLSSPGGHVGGSLQLGLMLRALGSTVLVATAQAGPEGKVEKLLPSRCFSACAYALMGAKTRVVPSGSRVGVHRMHAFGDPTDVLRDSPGQRFRTADAQQVAVLKRYVAAVGVDPGVIDLAETVPPDNIRVLSPDEMKRYRMAVERPF